MKNYISLKNRYEFGHVYQCGKSYANKNLVIYVVENSGKDNRLGISVSKKVGNSVVRHRITRLIRECYRLHQMDIRQGYDIVVVARRSSKESNYHDMERAYIHLMKLHKLFIQNEE